MRSEQGAIGSAVVELEHPLVPCMIVLSKFYSI